MKDFRFAVPTVLALLGVVVLMRAIGIESPFGVDGHLVHTAPTPYSISHAIVQSRPGDADEQPPTF